MDNYVQLELFDLQPYTSEQPSVTEDVPELVEEIQQSSKYEQLELNLFPQQICITPLEFIKLAA
ncbi:MULTISPECIES: hypothetical protein [unclassified Nostoc]|jgi:hypothetical protein|uniref:hypothetical protein n=1 Tax=unclassified Nostoc TaxID=2593658 RepID=UPI001DBD6AA1|nr:hypothetical protein [Nostoc sp. JL23]MBN3880991.1 hypothetical protein [Nostoc sp. JL23]